MTENIHIEFLILIFHKLGVMSFFPLLYLRLRGIEHLNLGKGIRLLISHYEKVSL